MKHRLTRSALNCSSYVELSEAEYLEIVSAKRKMMLVLGIEEKFDLLLANYREYESTLLELALKFLTGSIGSYSSFHDARGSIDRRLLNLLSSARTYTDQSKHDIGLLAGVATREFLEQLFSCEYDTHLSYRVLETLRNYVQHRGLPVGMVQFPGEWIDHDSPAARRRHRVRAGLDVETLVSDGSLKPDVMKELTSTGARFLPLTPMLRRYIDSFGRVHGHLRRKLEAITAEAERLLRSTHGRAITACGGSPVGIVVRREEPGNPPHEQHDIVLEMIDRRQELVARNATSLNLTRGYVSGEDEWPHH